jgi:4-hydroxybenzoate polyprenyltransferase
MSNPQHSDTPQRNGLWIKVVALLLQVRWQNVLGMAIAQYIAAIYLFNKNHPWTETLGDGKLHGIVFSVAFLVAGGYLINNFYDHEKDHINRPLRTAIEDNLRKSTVLYGYFITTIIGSLIALAVSFKAFLFYGGYAFLLWAYSHKFKKITFLGNLIATFLVVIPFFGLLLYYHALNLLVVYYGFFFSWLLFMRESIKDIRFYKGDMVMEYLTVPVALGLSKAIRLLRVYALLGILISAGLWLLPFSRITQYYSLPVIAAYTYILIFLSRKNLFHNAFLLHNGLKILLVSGIGLLPFLF